jgi:hypothetical protein
VRRPAKASSTGTTSNEGGLALIASLCLSVVALLALFLISALALSASSAFAAPTHLPQVVFGPEGPSGPGFSRPNPVGVDPSSSEIYVGSTGDQAIYRFDADGAPLAFSGSGGNIEGNKLSGLNFPEGPKESQIAVSPLGTIYANTRPSIRAFEPSGEPSIFSAGPGSGTNELGGFTELLGVAVDSNNAIYGADWATQRISIFSSAGAPLTSFPVSFNPANIAVGPTGTVYVVNYSSGVQSFVPSSFPVTGTTTYTSGSEIDSSNVYGVAVDPTTGNVFTTFTTGPGGGGVHEYSPAGALLSTFARAGEPGEQAEPGGIAVGARPVVVDGRSFGKATIFGSLVTVPTAETQPPSPIGFESAALVGTVNPEGAPVVSCHFDYGTTAELGLTVSCLETSAQIGEGSAPVPVHADVTGLTPSQQYFFRLGAANASGEGLGQVAQFSTTRAPILPVITDQRLIQVDARGATVNASLDSGGLQTTYFIEFGATSAYGQRNDARILAPGDQAQSIYIQLNGLTPQADYHYRLVAENALGRTETEDGQFRTPSVGGGGQESCPNEGFRVGAASRLPDCRAYEMVSPVEKNGIDIDPSVDVPLYFTQLEQASLSGDALTFTSSQGIGDPEGVPYASQYLSSRTADGWRTRSLANPQGTNRALGAGARLVLEYLLFTPDLCSAFLQNFSETPLASNAAVGYPNLYKRDLCGGGGLAGLTPEYREKPSPERGFPPLIGGASSDGQCVIYFPLYPRPATGFPAGAEREGIVEMCGETRRQVNVLPNGEASEFAQAGDAYRSSQYEALRNSILKNAVSEDGSTIYWVDPPNGGDSGPLYVRVNARAEQSDLGPGDECLEPEKACTFPISELIDTEAKYFDAASADGSRMFFHSEVGSNGSLYEYDLTTRSSHLIATGVSPGDGRGNSGGVVMGASDDGSHLYFASRSALDGEGTPGALNLYLYEAEAGSEGETRFIADITEASSLSNFFLPIAVPAAQVSRVTPDGQHAVFATRARIPGYDNRDLSTGEPSFEVYVYDATADGGAGKLSCVSCNPSGQRPSVTPLVLLRKLSDEYAGGLIPPFQTSFQAPRAITDDGSKVFFEAFEALVPQDTNGRADVYQWTKEGTTGCSLQTPSYSPANGGCLALISSGEGAADSRLVDATANGSDVFFATSQSLAVQDPGLIDIYDARVNGGFPPPPGLPPACEGEACQGPLNPPNDATPSSSTYRGPGNEKQAKAKKKKSKKKSQQHKKKKKQSKGKKQRAANNGRTAR